ncbi:hypothetical protein ACO1O0_005838 [Amphichorda felina]
MPPYLRWHLSSFDLDLRIVYSHTNDRIKRIARRHPSPIGLQHNLLRPRRQLQLGLCLGTEPLGASTDPYSFADHNEFPSDTPENQGLDRFARQLRDGADIKLFVDWHSYGKYILHPFGYNETVYPPETSNSLLHLAAPTVLSRLCL